MNLVRRLAAGPRARWVWAGLTGVILVGLVAAAIAAGGALAAAEGKARAQAARLVERDIAPALTSALFDGTSGTGSEQELVRAIRAVVGDERARAVRVWRADGKPVFDGGAEPLRIVPVSGPISAAVSGRVVGREVAPAVDAPDDAGSVYQVFVPVKVGDRKNAGVVEVEVPFSSVLSEVQGRWPLVRSVLAVALAVTLGMLIAAFWFAAPQPRRWSSEALDERDRLPEETSPLVGRSSVAAAAAGSPPPSPAAATDPTRPLAGAGASAPQARRGDDAVRARLEFRVAELEAQLERSERARLDLLAITPNAAESLAADDRGSAATAPSGPPSSNGHDPSRTEPAAEPKSPAEPSPAEPSPAEPRSPALPAPPG